MQKYTTLLSSFWRSMVWEVSCLLRKPVKILIMASSQNVLCYCSYIYLHFTLFCILFVNILEIYLYVAHAWLMNWSYYITPLHIEFQWQLHTVISWVVMLCQLVREQHLEGTSCYNLQGQRCFGIPPKVCYNQQYYIMLQASKPQSEYLLPWQPIKLYQWKFASQ